MECYRTPGFLHAAAETGISELTSASQVLRDEGPLPKAQSRAGIKATESLLLALPFSSLNNTASCQGSNQY